MKPATEASSSTPRGAASFVRWIFFAAILAALWFWQSGQRDASHPEIDYSTAYGWIEHGKVVSVVLEGRGLDGVLSAPETVDNRTVRSFHTMVPADDTSLVPLLRGKAVRIRVADEDRPFAIQLADHGAETLGAM